MARGYLNGYPATMGGKAAVVGTLTGPTSYANGTGQLFQDSSARSIDFVCGGVSLSGTYEIIAQPKSLKNGSTWYFRWTVISSGLEVANTTNLSGESFQFFAVYS